MDFTRTSGAPTGRGSPRRTVYEIRDPEGRVVAEHVREDRGPSDKEVKWRRPNGGWGRNGTPPEALPLYGAEKLSDWPDHRPVVLVEGEKAADALNGAGIILALGTVTGASGTPGAEALEILRDREVILWPDADEPGHCHMRRVAEHLQGVAASVSVYNWHEAPNDVKGPDAADHPAVIGESEKALGILLDDLLSAPRWEPKKPEGLQGRVLLGQMLQGGIEPTPQLLNGLLYEARIHSIASGPGTGKTLLAEWMAIRVMEMGHRVLYLDAENGPKLIAERLQELGADLDALDDLFFYYPADLTLDAESMARLKATVEEVGPALVVFDSFADFLALAGLEENSNSDCTLWMTRVAQPLKDAGVAVLLLDHVPKSGNGGPRGAGSKVAKVDVAWSLEVTLSFDRERTGQITLKHTKDREAWLPRMVQFSVGGGVFARSSGTVEQREVDGLTNSQRTALEALKPHPEGLAYSEWKGACGVPTEMGNGTFDNARRALLEAGLVRKERQRWFALGPGTPPGTPRPESAEESGTPNQVHLDGLDSNNSLQNRGTPTSGVPEVYQGVVANRGGTPTHTPRIRGVGVPMAGVPEDVPLDDPPDDYDRLVEEADRRLEELGF